MIDRTETLNNLFIHAEQYMADLIAKQGKFSNFEILRLIAQERQQDYIDLLYSFRDTPNRSPFNAAHQEIGGRILNLAQHSGYERAAELDRMGKDIFGNPSKEKFYRVKQG